MTKSKVTPQERTEASLQNWREKEKTALSLLQIVGNLRFDRSVELVFLRKAIYDTRPSELIALHDLSKNNFDTEVPIHLTLKIAQAVDSMNHLLPAKIDIGKLSIEWLQTESLNDDLYGFIFDKLSGFQDPDVKGNGADSKDVVLYGFGRIGRLVARRIIESTGRGTQLRLKAIVIRKKMKTIAEELEKRASLLRTDSIHGDFNGVVKIDSENSELIINGNRVKLISAGSPDDIDYTKYGIKNGLVIDNTGVWRNKNELSIHLRPGISQVMLTAPGDGIPNIVYGVNQKDLDLEENKVFCAASCTTNAIVPPLKVLDDAFGIARGHVETIHAYTNDQNLLDNFHKKPRRGRGGPVNMVMTSTGAAKAVGVVLPHLGDNLTGNAVRVPVPDGSLAILSLTLKKATTVEKLNNVLKNAAFKGTLAEQIQYSTSIELASSNIVGSTGACVIDSPSTIVSKDGKNATVYAWYDNEYGYTCQVVRLAKYAAKVRRNSYYL